MTLEIVSSLDGVTKTSSTTMDPAVAVTPTVVDPQKSPVTSPSDNTGIIVAVVVSILVIILIIILAIIIYLWCRRRQANKYSYAPQFNDKEQYDMQPVCEDYDPMKNWNTVYSTRESRFIMVGRELLPGGAPYHSNGIAAPNVNNPPMTFSQEFSELPHTQLSPWNVALHRNVAHLNR